VYSGRWLLTSRRKILPPDPEDGRNRFLRKINNHLPDYTGSHPDNRNLKLIHMSPDVPINTGVSK
jgi:hypothetical protein